MNNLRVEVKLICGFLCVALAAALIGFIAYSGLTSMGETIAQLDTAGGSNLAEKATELKSRQETAQTAVLWATLVVCGIIIVGGYLLSRSLAQPLVQAVATLQEVTLGRTTKRLRYRRNDEIGTLANLVDSLADDFQQVQEVLNKVAEGDISIDLKPRGDRDQLTLSVSKIVDSVRNVGTQVQRLSRYAAEGRIAGAVNYEQAKGFYRDIIQSVHSALESLLLPLNDAAAVLTTLAGGDSTVRVKSEYRGDLIRIKEALNAAMNRLEEGFSQVATSAEQVAAAAGGISNSSHGLAQSASDQASSLEEISSSLRQMAAMTKQATGNAKEAKSLTDAARHSADRGVESMRRLSAAIDRIKASSDETAKIVKTIDEIAFQTNLLALNAAVEAARAGDAGKGFAVVAEEVRNLAMRSAEAAKTTANLIEESVKNAEGGVSINQEVLNNLEEINQQVRKVSDVMAEMAAASDQQSEGIDQITIAVERMNLLTQQTAANSEESASAAQQLADQAEEMKRVLSRYRLSLNPAPKQAALNAAPTPAPASTEAAKTTAKISAKRPHVLPPPRPATSKPAAGAPPEPSKLIPLDDADTRILQEF